LRVIARCVSLAPFNVRLFYALFKSMGAMLPCFCVTREVMCSSVHAVLMVAQVADQGTNAC
jgi:hypothetical protein